MPLVDDFQYSTCFESCIRENTAPEKVVKKRNRKRRKSKLRDAQFRREAQALSVELMPRADEETSVKRAPDPSPSESPLPPTSEPKPSAPRSTRRRWFESTIAPPPVKHRTPAEWRDTSLQQRLDYYLAALQALGPTQTITIDLRPDVEALARSKPSAMGWLRPRITRELHAAFGRVIELFLVAEETPDQSRRLHLHGVIGVSEDDAKLARQALRKAAGEWKKAPQRQTKTDPDPDAGWCGYLAKDLWKKQLHAALTRHGRSSLAATFKGRPEFVTHGVTRKAKEIYAAHRLALLRARRGKSILTDTASIRAEK